jgi:hypothetical protein
VGQGCGLCEGVPAGYLERVGHAVRSPQTLPHDLNPKLNQRHDDDGVDEDTDE